MAKLPTLVIVESPAKARTIAKYLGAGYVVESSIGHIRDLPRSAAEIPARYRSHAWARLGLNPEEDFAPLYVVSADKRAHVARLKKLAAEAGEVILATDEDREGESIAWHLYQELKPRVPVRRITFKEITKDAIRRALEHPRDIDTNLVEAQETRRALDRLYGYEVSPVLWKKVAPKLSAGRVQSVATRLLVDRERERMAFVSGTWWDLALTLKKGSEAFPANLLELGGVRLASGKDFDPATGRVREGAKVRLLDEAEAGAVARVLEGGAAEVVSAEEKPFTQRPSPPFITSTLQQEGSRKLGFAAQRTMRAAQKLYEGGYITYMRTDSVTLSGEATSAARAQISALYGPEYLPEKPRVYRGKSKNAQEAHEAIRPSGGQWRTPASLQGELQSDEWRLYELIWKRTVASQMADARGVRLQVRLRADAGGEMALLGAGGRTVTFPGFLRVYVEGRDDPAAALEDRDVVLPPLAVGDRARVQEAIPESHQTQPPARFTEATLVRELEGAGIGRPSTYASILGTIVDRGYVQKRGQALVPTWTAFATSALLEHHFGQLVDYDFTARMEGDLDEIAAGRQARAPYLRGFYHGEGGGYGLRDAVEGRLGEIDARAIATVPVPRLAGSGIELRVGRYGPYLEHEGARVTLPDTVAPDDLTLEAAQELLAGSGDIPVGTDPETGQPVFARSGRYGPYVQLGGFGDDKPLKMASLFPGDSLGELTLERALQLLSLPRLVGVSGGEEVWAQNGRYGPYLKRGSESRSLGSHDALFTVTLAEAEELFRQPKYAGRGRAAAPLQTFAVGDATINLLGGRYGPYLTDGEKNATVKPAEIEGLTAERAAEILTERGKEPKRKAGSKGASAKKTAKKPAAKKAASGKAATKKAAATKTTAKKPAAKAQAAKLTWDELKPHLGVLSDTEARLLRGLREEGRKIEELAAELGLEPNKAKGMNLQASKRLNAAARGS